MVNLDLNKLSKIVVDDEDLYLITDEQCQAVLKGAKIDGSDISELKIFGIHNELSINNEEISLAIRRGLYSRNRWWPCLLLRQGSCYYRVDVHQEVCNSCGWNGVVAAPLVYGIYTGVPNKESAIARAKSLSEVKCPKCGSGFSNFYVWVSEKVEVK